MNELYSQVWAQVFANAWAAYQGKPEGQAKACKTIADSAAAHLQVIDGWGEYANLDDEQALDTSAALLHEVGFRAGMSVDDACAMFKAARESK